MSEGEGTVLHEEPLRDNTNEKVNSGDGKIPQKPDYPKPQKLEPLRGPAGRSKPIVILDAKTIVIPSFRFDNTGPDGKFWVGTGRRPSRYGRRVPNENGKEEELWRYDRETIVLTLPDDLTVHHIDYFGVWCEKYDIDLGHIQIPRSLNVPPYLSLFEHSLQKEEPVLTKQHMENIVSHLESFKTKRKIIRGNIITEWFNIGEYVFDEFYKLGISIEWDLSTVKYKPEVCEIIAGITRNQDWLQTFLTIYPSLRIDLEFGLPAADICRIRSGIEVLRGLVNINASFDKVLQNFEELGDLDELDEQLKAWIETGHRPEFFPGDQDSTIPKSHWWWY